MCTTLGRDYRVTSCFVYKRLDQLTDKLSDSDKGFDLLGDIKPYRFEPLAKKVTDSINREELDTGSTDVDPQQPPVPLSAGPTLQQDFSHNEGGGNVMFS